MCNKDEAGKQTERIAACLFLLKPFQMAVDGDARRRNRERKKERAVKLDLKHAMNLCSLNTQRGNKNGWKGKASRGGKFVKLDSLVKAAAAAASLNGSR